jgi:DNA-binding GntR family transcriptional regulator
VTEPRSNGLGQTITDALIEQLRGDIRTGVIAPGTRLRQLEVAARFNVSTTPVREAFTALEREGLLVSVPHRGVVVFHPTVDDLRETYEIRISLEALATRLAVDQATDGEIEQLRKIVDQMEAAKNSTRYATLNAEFHSRIYALARRPKLEKLINDLRASAEVYLRLYATFAPGTEESHHDHVAIFDAIRRRDAEAAAAAMATHLEHTVRLVSSGLDET